jgi:hypothetical protein
LSKNIALSASLGQLSALHFRLDSALHQVAQLLASRSIMLAYADSRCNTVNAEGVPVRAEEITPPALITWDSVGLSAQGLRLLHCKIAERQTEVVTPIDPAGTSAATGVLPLRLVSIDQVNLTPTKEPGDEWTADTLADLLRQYNQLHQANPRAKASDLHERLGKVWGYKLNSVKTFITRARTEQHHPGVTRHRA